MPVLISQWFTDLQELGSLTGLRYYYSMALEAFDFLAPLLERLFSRIGDAGVLHQSKCMVVVL